MLKNHSCDIKINPIICECCEKDENDNWIHDEPCCNIGGLCEAETKDKNDKTSYCLHCGAEMFKEFGCWYHYTQKEIPDDERIIIHLGI